MAWYNLFKKENQVKPGCKENKCNCALKYYLQAVRNGTMKLTQADIYEAINTRLDPEVNKYFCHCQPERLSEKTSDDRGCDSLNSTR